MKYIPNRLTEYTQESIIAEIQRVAALNTEEYLSLSFFKENAMVGISTIRRKFGNWETALNKAGLSHLYLQPATTNKDKELAKNLTDEEVIEELKSVAIKLGTEKLTVEQFKKNARIGADTVRTRFGTWKNALNQAGLSSVEHGKRYTDSECFNNLLDVWTHYGRPPKYIEMNLEPSTVGAKAYIKRWGTWTKALHAFTEEMDKNISNLDIDEKNDKIKSKQKQKSSIINPREPTIGMRYKVLKRDNFKCVICGRSPATDPGCELHIDHIFPFSKGGKTELDNLQTLCKECNLGKSDKI